MQSEFEQNLLKEQSSNNQNNEKNNSPLSKIRSTSVPINNKRLIQQRSISAVIEEVSNS